MNFKSLAMLLVGPILLSACAPEPDMAMRTQKPAELKSAEVGGGDRITITRIGIFQDTLAYGDRRGVYLINDSKTGKEYLGVSGIGISEIGCHWVSTGKSGYCQSDER